MKVRLLKPWKQWSLGHEFPDMPANQAQVLIGRGLAEEIVPTLREKSGKSSRAGMRAGHDYITR